MLRIATHPATAVGVALALLGVGAGRGCAQANPYTTYAPVAPVYTPRYWGYFWNPYGGYLHGAADVINAQGAFMVNQQQAFLMREQYRSMKIDRRRKELEQWLWEREHLPTPEDEHERYQIEQLRRSRNDPPITEIWSAKALNDLLIDAEKIDSPGAQAASSALDPEKLAKINVTSGKGGGNIGLLKGGRVWWPLLLRRKEFTEHRERIDQLIDQAGKQAAQGQIEASVLEELLREADALSRELMARSQTAGNAATWTPTMYFDAKNFLRQFDDALKVLQQPNAADYLAGKYAAQGQTVAELVAYMRKNGLRFAPATPGSEEAYLYLHRELAAYDTASGNRELRPRR